MVLYFNDVNGPDLWYDFIALWPVPWDYFQRPIFFFSSDGDCQRGHPDAYRKSCFLAGPSAGAEKEDRQDDGRRD